MGHLITPKGKAKELFEKYFESLFEEIHNISDRANAARRCALIAVDEVWIALNLEHSYGDVYTFWSNVKFELDNL